MPASPTAAQWTLSNEKLLVDFLHEHRAASGDGGNFKTATFQAAASVVEAKQTIGGPKTKKACQNKWAAVCPLPFISRIISKDIIASSCVPCHSGHYQPHQVELV